jgi:phage anti-repressor protein
MNELIKVTEENGKQVVSARELHKFLESTERFSTWFERQLQYGFIENEDYIGCKEFNTLANQEVMNYAVSFSMAKEISMIQRTDKGKQARAYFIECEKQLQSKAPKTLKEALILALQQQEQIELLEAKTENLNTVLDNLLEWVSILKVAKHNKVHEKKFNWRKLKEVSTELGYLIKKAESPRYGFQNLYHIDVFRACYPEYNYNLKK